MKHLKYLLFIILSYLVFTTGVEAKIDSNNLINLNNVFTINYYDNSKDESDTEFSTESFCERTEVGNTFKTLGWILFFAKIIVPIIIIIFGSLDFAKAIVASKDDEIKKSAKSLAMRAIAGIIIFFIPTIINFIVSFIGGEDIYNKSFGVCTNCLLNPRSCKVKEIEINDTYENPNPTPTPEITKPLPKPDSPSSSGSQSGSQSGSSLNISSGTTTKTLGGVTYHITVPENATSNLPLIVFLHGIGEVNKPAQLKNIKPVTFVTSNEAFKNGKFIFIAPVATVSNWDVNKSTVMEIINTTADTYKVNKNKIIIMGFSMGGIGVWSFLSSYPDFFSAAVAVSGCANTNVDNVKTPILAISGSQESGFTSCLKATVNRINQNGGNAKYSQMGAGHINVQNVFPNDEVFSWALNQTKK